MMETTNTQPLQSGDVVQYRKVGTARVVEYQMSAKDAREDGSGWWTMEWIKAPKKYREGPVGGMFWVGPRDRI